MGVAGRCHVTRGGASGAAPEEGKGRDRCIFGFPRWILGSPGGFWGPQVDFGVPRPPMAAAPALALALPCLALAQTSPSITSNGSSNGTAPQPGGGLSPAGVVALSVIFGGLGALALLALLLLAALRLREKRRTEGSYRPSREEMGGGRQGAPPGPPPLRLPPEERLI
ncbi:LOW QUALITY PROTEIN: protein crumbs homolog 3 [Haemorhous mexicanus]|uniref:LOW QUALITY PROTEIN: protein crumbs homolog 3 n=1 Tax=Haemorhous mexicanus TaxID=30427 RepID=UPI0028BE0A1C|nr:LOW QUALITY PROTEIN: protein crumbs homolog 3 [Haemorhous mexicanus]